MKKIVVICLAILVFQKWDVIDNYLNPPPDYSATSGEQVILYATSWCGYCAKARKLLSDNNIPYKEYDIETSREGRKQYDSLKGNGVPVLQINGTVVYGYNPSKIMKLVNKT